MDLVVGFEPDNETVKAYRPILQELIDISDSGKNTDVSKNQAVKVYQIC